MFKQHRLVAFDADFNPVLPDVEIQPTPEFVSRRIAESLTDNNILNDLLNSGGDAVPQIGEVRITTSAFAQIRDMWLSGDVTDERRTIPSIPLKFYTCGLHRKDGCETVDVEIIPGLDQWFPL